MSGGDFVVLAFINHPSGNTVQVFLAGWFLPRPDPSKQELTYLAYSSKALAPTEGPFQTQVQLGNSLFMLFMIEYSGFSPFRYLQCLPWKLGP